MAILVDLNQVVISNIMMQTSGGTMKLDEDLIRHMVLNSIRAYRKQFYHQYGEVIICCDNLSYWRRKYFPYYKVHRKRDREKSPLDWKLLFDTLDKVRTELRETFPYKVVEAAGAEADDVIAVLAPRLSPHEKVLILSSDKDFMQLQKYPNVDQFSPILKKFIRSDNPLLYVKEHILSGDRGDGIPNFLSADNVFAEGNRQKSLSKKKLAEWVKQSPADFCKTTEMQRGYARNQILIDFDYIPEDIRASIVKAFDDAKPGTRNKLLNYFIEKKLRNLTEVINDF